MNKEYLKPENFMKIIENELNATNPFVFKEYFGYKQNEDGSYDRNAFGEKTESPIIINPYVSSYGGRLWDESFGIETSLKLNDNTIFLTGSNHFEIKSSDYEDVSSGTLDILPKTTKNFIYNDNEEIFLAGQLGKYQIKDITSELTWTGTSSNNILSCDLFDENYMIMVGENGKYQIIDVNTLTFNDNISFGDWGGSTSKINKVKVLSNNNAILIGDDGKYEIRDSSGNIVVENKEWSNGTTDIKDVEELDDGNLFLVGLNGSYEIIDTDGNSIYYDELNTGTLETNAFVSKDNSNNLIFFRARNNETYYNIIRNDGKVITEEIQFGNLSNVTSIMKPLNNTFLITQDGGYFYYGDITDPDLIMNDYFVCNTNEYTNELILDEYGNEIEFNFGEIALYQTSIDLNGIITPELPDGQEYYFVKLEPNSLKEFSFSIVNEIDERNEDYNEQVREIQCQFSTEFDSPIAVEGFDLHEVGFSVKFHILTREWALVNEILRQYVANKNGFKIVQGNNITVFNYSINPPINLSNYNGSSYVTPSIDITASIVTNGSIGGDVELYIGDENKENYERVYFTKFNHIKNKQTPNNQYFGDEYIDKGFVIGQSLSFGATLIYTKSDVLIDMVKESLAVDLDSLEKIRSLKIVDNSFGEINTNEYNIVVPSFARELTRGELQILTVGFTIARIQE